MKSSCWDCIHIKDHPDPNLKNLLYWCEVFNVELTDQEARIPNNCPKKDQYGQEADVLEFPQYKILANIYIACKELAEYLERPFTVRELIDHLEYVNKNSLWMLLETLVKVGKVGKDEVTAISYNNQTFKANVYWPLDWKVQDDSEIGMELGVLPNAI